ncbi:MAG: PAS domain-containing protein, partial [Elusimicrobia bacterium]|nr:PAS domain-containing protein [Elusimicrobiota bacterium]
LHDAAGKVTGIVGLADDLTAREAVLKSIPDLFYRLDADMNLQDWNEVFERVSGYSARELKGRNALDFFARDAKIAADGIAEAVGKGLAYRTARLRTKQNKEIPIYWSAAALRSPEGTLQGLVGVGRDLTVKQK